MSGGRGPARTALLLIAAALAASCHARPSGPARPARPARPALPAHPALEQLRRDIDAVLDDPTLARGTWGVSIRSLKNGETAFARNGGRLLMPASTMKIVTLAAAAERLGWTFTYETRLAVTGRIENGVLEGDIVVIGSGDPAIGVADGSGERVFAGWADRLKALGIRSVAGRIVGDDNAFDDEELGFGWSWDDLAEDYAAGVGALQFNENAVQVRIAPGPAAGDFAAVSVEPAGGLIIDSRVRTGASGSTPSLHARRLPGRDRLALDGTIAAGAEPARLSVSVDNPTLFFVDSFRRALADRGIDVRGPAVDIDSLSEPQAERRIVDTHRSPSLSALAVRLMKASQNQYAETFIKTIGTTEREGFSRAVGSIARGHAIALEIFTSWGIPAASFILRDGSGLSRYDYVTTDALVAILAHLHGEARLRDAFDASLPIAAQDGTLANRFKDSAAATTGHLRAKTGSMSNVRALAGYVDSADGEPFAFAIIANNFETTADVVNGATDAIVTRVASFRR